MALQDPLVCEVCGANLKPLFTSTFCPNGCDLEEPTPPMGYQIEREPAVNSDGDDLASSIRSDRWSLSDDDIDDWLESIDEWWAARSVDSID